MKKIVRIAFLACVSLFFVACSPDDAGTDSGQGGVSGLSGFKCCYVLNSGEWKNSSTSSLTKYNIESGLVEQGYFERQNGRKLGNLPNDMVVYGSKMYIAVSGESTIEITDLDAKSVKQINCEEQPRYFATHNGKVYVSLYNEGYVARIDTATLQVDAKVKVGRNPEQLTVLGNKLYVANSGGMDLYGVGADNTVSVIDLVSFEEVEKVEVVLNPMSVVSVPDGVFVVSAGNYADVSGALQFIDATTGEVSVVEGCNMTELCYNSGVLYGFLSQYDEMWNETITFYSYCLDSKAVVTPWINEKEKPVPYKVCGVGDFVAVTSSDHINDGDVYVYDADGMLVLKIAAGLEPVKMIGVK